MIRFVLFLMLFVSMIFANKSKYQVDYSIDLPLIIAAGSISFGSKLIGLKSSYNQEDYRISDLNWLDRQGVYYYNSDLSTISDITIGGFFIAAAGLNVIKQNRSHYLGELTIITETVLLSNLLNTVVKYSINRPRPYIYSGKANHTQARDFDATHSFYSGHTSNAFALAVSFATLFSDRFNQKWQKGLIWGGSLLTAGTIGYLRVRAGKHFYSDVIVGAVVGSTFGYFIPYLHKKKRDIGMIPIAGGGMVTLGGVF